MRSVGGAAGATLAVLGLFRPGGWAAAGRTPVGPQRRPCSSGPPWRLLFFGSDLFAVESLKVLAGDRVRADGAVSSLEVVTLSDGVPVANFARHEGLRLHRWPPGDADGRFDVGVVVSFGRLLQRQLIEQFPCGILNVHPSLLPRWRGPAPIFHTILNGDAVTGVTIMQMRPHRFDTGPILNQVLHRIPESGTADELSDVLAAKGARLLLDTLRTLPQKMADKWEQSRTGVTFAPKIGVSASRLVWEEQTCEQIDRLYRAVGSRIPLRTTWMGATIKLLDFAGRCHISLAGESGSRPCVAFALVGTSTFLLCFPDERGERPPPGSVTFRKESDALAVRCKVARSLTRSDALAFALYELSTVLLVFCFSGRLGGFQGGGPEEAYDGGRLLQRLLASDDEAARRRRVCQPAKGRERVDLRDASRPRPQKHDGCFLKNGERRQYFGLFFRVAINNVLNTRLFS
ncbi:methionyl-tRNA formyltransferase, mitochondrial isoform X2 [Phyllopteryx taeniolatus]|uniref:methionyl-tRNA formyltransferase, mitochondrial isoform X2 n=1 Tax=Phyllopteryx taeniolatus TaxID=161469 RepID=UPI002AD58C88|nr:methionyl-tRNA formyltransferase, mitochondrial isoform X2 [Phyllopteryx taeniolatus]